MEYLTLNGITKIYPNGIVANDCVNFSLRKGEIHAILGENGAGKSTIMKILYGLETMEEGSIFLEGKEIEISTPADALRYKIGMVPQHFTLVNEMTVSENVFLGIEKVCHGLLDKQFMYEKTIELCQRYHMNVNPNLFCRDLSVSSAQKVSILKALVRGTQILIMDEPTAVLAPQETEELFHQLRMLKQDGHSIIIITHKLKEVKQLCDRLTIMRAGRDRGVFNVIDITEQEISKLMVGNDIQLSVKKIDSKPAEVVLKVSDLTVTRENKTNALDSVTFCVRKGEIVCIVGVEGNGQFEVIQCITGLSRQYRGKITLQGKDIKTLDVRQIRENGLAYIPEDRLKTGSDPLANVLENFIALSIQKNCRLGVIRYRSLKTKAWQKIKEYDIKVKNLSQPMSSLSGGNMQKMIVAREFAQDPIIIVADQPSRGVDVGATELIHKKIIEFRDAGKAVLLVSSDLSEVMNLADRILVFHNGRINAHITEVAKLTEEQLGKYMLGVENMASLGEV